MIFSNGCLWFAQLILQNSKTDKRVFEALVKQYNKEAITNIVGDKVWQYTADEMNQNILSLLLLLENTLAIGMVLLIIANSNKSACFLTIIMLHFCK